MKCPHSRQASRVLQMLHIRESPKKVEMLSRTSDIQDLKAHRQRYREVLRWLGHCYSFDRALQLIYEVARSRRFAWHTGIYTPD